MKRKQLETTACELAELTNTIKTLKARYCDKHTQIEVLEHYYGNYFVTVWWLR